MKTQPRQRISNKYNTCTVVTSPVYIGSKVLVKKKMIILASYVNMDIYIRKVYIVRKVTSAPTFLA